MTLAWTLLLMAAGAAMALFARWQESRPRALGEVSLVPTTLILGVGVLLVVLSTAHLVSLLTGIQLKGNLTR